MSTKDPARSGRSAEESLPDYDSSPPLLRFEEPADREAARAAARAYVKSSAKAHPVSGVKLTLVPASTLALNYLCTVRPAALDSVPEIHALLGILTDVYAPKPDVFERVAHIPVLAARCVRQAREVSQRFEIIDLAYALSVIGNAGVEKELLEVLEELTVLKTDLQEGKTPGVVDPTRPAEEGKPAARGQGLRASTWKRSR